MQVLFYCFVDVSATDAAFFGPSFRRRQQRLPKRQH